ncbi:MAG: hypothetical protein U5K54_09290 [Cytophagales bacterium]|nr:hypothetical protein [Cytophagales bacterium]
MQGWFTRNFIPNPNPVSELVSDAYEVACKQGEAENCHLIVHLKIDSQNIYNTVSDDNPDHDAKVSGTVICKELSHKPITNASGVFKLFTIDQQKVETWNMVYDMHMQSTEGVAYHFYGQKILTRTKPRIGGMMLPHSCQMCLYCRTVVL